MEKSAFVITFALEKRRRNYTLICSAYLDSLYKVAIKKSNLLTSTILRCKIRVPILNANNANLPFRYSIHKKMEIISN